MRARGSRTGFTLVEMLIVVAIIAVLLGAITMATSAMLRATRTKTTEQTITTTFGLLDARWKEVREEAGRETVPANVVALAGSQERGKQLWIKIRLKEAFPVSFAEITNCYSDPMTSMIPASPQNLRRYNASYKQAIANRVAANTRSWEHEASACLLLALTTGRAAVDNDALGVNWRDTDGDQLKEVVDGWGNPIVFYRFPVGTDLQSANPSPSVMTNPLYQSNWTGAGKTAFETYMHRLTISGQNAYTVPVLVSGGPDNRTGMTPNTTSPYDQFSVGTVKDAGDNFYSFKLGLGN